ncbi:MAG: hypothetical protein ACI4S4_07900 [Candidatus Ornithospirochaeta sp.]
MTIERDDWSPIGRSLSPNIADGSRNRTKTWKCEDVVLVLLKNAIPLGEDSIVSIPWALLAQKDGETIYSVQIEREDLRILSYLTGESLRSLQEDYGTKGFLASSQCVMYGGGMRENIGPFTLEGEEESVSYLIDAALDSLDLVESPEEL